MGSKNIEANHKYEFQSPVKVQDAVPTCRQGWKSQDIHLGDGRGFPLDSMGFPIHKDKRFVYQGCEI